MTSHDTLSHRPGWRAGVHQQRSAHSARVLLFDAPHQQPETRTKIWNIENCTKKNLGEVKSLIANSQMNAAALPLWQSCLVPVHSRTDGCRFVAAVTGDYVDVPWNVYNSHQYLINTQFNGSWVSSKTSLFCFLLSPLTNCPWILVYSCPFLVHFQPLQSKLQHIPYFPYTKHSEGWNGTDTFATAL